MLLQAANFTFSEFPLITASQLFPGLLLLLLSAAFKAVVRSLEHESGDRDYREYRRARLAARLGQYLLLTAGAVVLVAPGGSPLRNLLLVVIAFLSYLPFMLLARALAVVAPAGVLRSMRLPMLAWSLLAAPLVWLSHRADEWLERRQAEEETDEPGERLEAWLASSGLESDELDLFRNAVRFRERNVGELMVPRPDVVWLSVEDDVADLIEQVRESGHSRFPLCLGSPDQVVGYVHVRDLGLLKGMPSAEQLKGLARRVSFVPEAASAMALLRRFQREQSHMAVVVDEFGGTAGIVTLEDLLEALVGEIRDEFDDDEEIEVTRLWNGDVLVDGGVRLDELERGYGLDFGEVEEDTVGGFVFGRLAREVSTGDEVELEGAVLRVESVDGLRVTRVRVIPLSAPEPA